MGSQIGIQKNSHISTNVKEIYGPHLNFQVDVVKIHNTSTMSSNATTKMKHGRKWKTLLKWEESNKAVPHLIAAIMYSLSSWSKGRLPSPPPPLLSHIARSFDNQTNISWIQVLIVILTQDWSDIQNQQLQVIGVKTNGHWWIYALIIKLWYTAWNLWNHRNHTLYYTYVPTKMDIWNNINDRIIYHYNIGMTVIPQRFQFLSKTTIHTLITRLLSQRLSCLS